MLTSFKEMLLIMRQKHKNVCKYQSEVRYKNNNKYTTAHVTMRITLNDYK